MELLPELHRSRNLVRKAAGMNMGLDRHYDALLDVADLLVRQQNLAEVLRELAQRLHSVTVFELASLSLYDPAKNVMRLHIWESTEWARVPEEVPADDSPSGWVWLHQQPLVISDLSREERFPRVFDLLRARGVRSYCVLPLSTAEKRLGTLGIGSATADAYQEEDVSFLRRVAELVALVIENSGTRDALHQEKERLQALLDINQALIHGVDPPRLLPIVTRGLQRVMKISRVTLMLCGPDADHLRLHAEDLPAEGIEVGKAITGSDSAARRALQNGVAQVFAQPEPEVQLLSGSGVFKPGTQSGCCVPLTTSGGTLGILSVASPASNTFLAPDIDFLNQAALQMAAALDNARAYREIAELKNKLSQEKLYLEDEILSELNFEEIIGESPSLKQVLAQAKIVAPSDATTLILGETGTGKELVARAIHRMSSRRDGSFIKLNCAAIPTGLLESELFGHEKGAFTGAISQKIGRLELADKGTLFLDEIGDIPLELQPKLLRVLQDQEFERLGSTRTIRVNIRLIAATNRDLAKSVASNEFRSDLYYRLNVFPLRVPPLRERKSDIPMLVRYFVQKFARRMNKQIETIPTETINALVDWAWPGNVRELENFMERSVILSIRSALSVPLAELRPSYELPGNASTLEHLEREHIIRTLRETRGVISGVKGAAARLGLKRTTLQSRLQKMGISRADYEG